MFIQPLQRNGRLLWLHYCVLSAAMSQYHQHYYAWFIIITYYMFRSYFWAVIRWYRSLVSIIWIVLPYILIDYGPLLVSSSWISITLSNSEIYKCRIWECAGNKLNLNAI
jgi:hypothetical protein